MVKILSKSKNKSIWHFLLRVECVLNNLPPGEQATSFLLNAKELSSLINIFYEELLFDLTTSTAATRHSLLLRQALPGTDVTNEGQQVEVCLPYSCHTSTQKTFPYLADLTQY